MIELLYFDGCPNHEAFLPHLRDLLAQAGTDADVQLRRVESPEAAGRERFLGSPTLRVEGRDVEPGASERDDFGLKCRLYRTDDGLAGIPPDEWVLAALEHGQTGTAGPINESTTKVGAALLALGIAPESFALSRAADLTPEERALYRSILEGFSSGEAPTLAALAGTAGAEPETLRSRLLRLETADLIDLDGRGEVALAYPFSARPTRQRVVTVDGRRLWACCAIDALGIPSMLGVSATVHGSEPGGRGEVKVSLEPSGEPSWQPTQALVLAARAASPHPAAEGSSARCACPHINFFTSSSNANRELAAHPELRGTTLSLPEATAAGRLLFGGLLSDLERA